MLRPGTTRPGPPCLLLRLCAFAVTPRATPRPNRRVQARRGQVVTTVKPEGQVSCVKTCRARHVHSGSTVLAAAKNLSIVAVQVTHKSRCSIRKPGVKHRAVQEPVITIQAAGSCTNVRPASRQPTTFPPLPRLARPEPRVVPPPPYRPRAAASLKRQPLAAPRPSS